MNVLKDTLIEMKLYNLKQINTGEFLFNAGSDSVSFFQLLIKENILYPSVPFKVNKAFTH